MASVQTKRMLVCPNRFYLHLSKTTITGKNSMHISKLDIRNFRNFSNATLLFEPGVNTLIGENGSGKTNVFYAIRLLLDDTLSRRANFLRESDFNRSIGSWKGHWIIISMTFDELDVSEGCQILRHNVGHMDEENWGTYTYFFRPKKEVRRKLFDEMESGTPDEEMRVLIESITLDQYEFHFTGRASADFADEGIYKQLVGNFETLRFPNPDDDDAELIGVPTATLHKEVTCTFVKALRDVVSDLRSYRDSPLLNLLRSSEQGIEFQDAKAIVEAVTKLNDDISALEEIRLISEGIQNTLRETVGHAYSPEIDIKSALPEDLQRLLQTLSLRVGDPNDQGYQGDLTELSLGGANLIYLSLKLFEYESKQSSDRVWHFLLIEEPEAHIHTHIQKTLFEKYGYKQTQVVVSTHSTHISAASKIRSVNILSKQPQDAKVFHPSSGLSPQKCQRIERYLDAVRSTLLFAKGVMLVEGDAELVLIPSLVKEVFGISIDELGVSLINMSAAVFENVAMIFHDSRVRRRCAIVTDADASIVDLPKTAAKDTGFQKRCRNSELSGISRMESLDDFCAKNEWVKPFYAKYTFEVDFLMCDNSRTVTPVISSIFRRQASRKKSRLKLEDTDVAVAGREILRLAEKKGKGWFALLLSEHLGVEANIPEYILRALAHASRDTINNRTLRLMGLHRIRAAEVDTLDTVALFPQIDDLEKLTASDFVLKYQDELPSDQLTKFIGFLGGAINGD